MKSQRNVRKLPKVFNEFNDGKKCSYIRVGEIHVKPGLRYQSKQTADSMLALVINTSFGAPSFVARLYQSIV